MPNGKGMLRKLLQGICSKEHPHYCIRQSARNPLEQDQVQRALERLSRSCHRTSNNQPRFMSMEIPWGYLAGAVLLISSKKVQAQGSCVKKQKGWWAITQWTVAPESSGKERKWEKNPVLSLLPGSHERLTLRKQAWCVPETWGHTYNVLPGSAQGLRKQDKKLDSHAAKKGTKKLVSSDCAKILD